MPSPKNSDRALDQLPKKANLRIREVAAFLDITTTTVYDLIHSGEIPAVKLGRIYRIPREKFVAVLDRFTFDSDE